MGAGTGLLELEGTDHTDGGCLAGSRVLDALLGGCPALVRVKHAAFRVATTDLPVLIEGETGTGKELLARAIHHLSRRRSGPLIPVNCASLSPELIESELFGHERGAFTGATAFRHGKIGAAHRGTIFLDEIGDLPLPLQGRLLRFLQNGEVQRVGRDLPLEVDARVVAATNRNLEEAVSVGTFRADLYHRLHCVKLQLPPLRERGDDVITIARIFLARFAREFGRNDLVLNADAVDVLRRWHWPGNVRELENTLRAVVLFADGPAIDGGELRRILIRSVAAAGPEPPLNAMTSADAYELTLTLLRRHTGNLSRVARDLGISRPTLYKRLKWLSIDYRRFRREPIGGGSVMGPLESSLPLRLIDTSHLTGENAGTTR